MYESGLGVARDYKEAMKEKNETKKIVLNLILAKIKNKKIELQKDLDTYLPDSLLGLNLDTKPRPNLLKTYKEFWTDEGLPSVRVQFEGVARKVAESP